jgi:hypothetical protein
MKINVSNLSSIWRRQKDCVSTLDFVLPARTQALVYHAEEGIAAPYWKIYHTGDYTETLSPRATHYYQLGETGATILIARPVRTDTCWKELPVQEMNDSYVAISEYGDFLTFKDARSLQQALLFSTLTYIAWTTEREFLEMLYRGLQCSC